MRSARGSGGSGGRSIDPRRRPLPFAARLSMSGRAPPDAHSESLSARRAAGCGRRRLARRLALARCRLRWSLLCSCCRKARGCATTCRGVSTLRRLTSSAGGEVVKALRGGSEALPDAKARHATTQSWSLVLTPSKRTHAATCGACGGRPQPRRQSPRLVLHLLLLRVRTSELRAAGQRRASRCTRGAYLQVRRALEARFPDLEVVGTNYPPGSCSAAARQRSALDSRVLLQRQKRRCLHAPSALRPRL